MIIDIDIMRLFQIPMNCLCPGLVPESIIAFRLTTDIFRILTKDETPFSLFTPTSVIDYLNLHLKKSVVLRGSAFASSYFPFSLG